MAVSGQDAQSILMDMAEMVADFSTAPTFADMPRRSLEDKLAAGPTSAHVVEEVHAPFNIAYLTFTTGSTAFQNIVGVTHQELPERVAAGKGALLHAGACEGDTLLVCYPPLANVFSRQVFDDLSIKPLFLPRSSRDAFLVSLCRERPRFVIGESTFLHAALQDAKRLGIWSLIPRGTVYLAAGTPLDQDLVDIMPSLEGTVHDLYGCQEFGWLAVDGVPLRSDLVLVDDPGRKGYRALVVGGLPTGDSFPVTRGGHLLNPEGNIITYARRRSRPDLEVVVRACTAQSALTVERTARTILRIKSRIVRLDPTMRTGASDNVLDLVQAPLGDKPLATLEEAGQLTFFQRMLEAQTAFQAESKTDPLWLKRG